MKKKVVITKPVPREVKTYLTAHFHCLECDITEELNKEQFFEMMSEAEGLLTSGLPINTELLNRAKKLKVVSNMAAGYDNFDLEAMRYAEIIGTHTPNVLDDTVADLIVGLMLATARRIAELDHLIRQGEWVKDMTNEQLFGIDVHDATLGIIGMGGIGEAVAKRARFGFDMDVLYYNRSRNKEAEEKYDARYCSLEQLLAQSDFVVVMTPLTKETEKMLGQRHFGMMKRSAIFINGSRGQIIDEISLIRALQTGRIRAAGLDVFEVEPLPSDHALLSMPNVVLTPHIGSATLKTRADMAMLAAQNLVVALAGETPPNLVKELQ